VNFEGFLWAGRLDATPRSLAASQHYRTQGAAGFVAVVECACDACSHAETLQSGMAAFQLTHTHNTTFFTGRRSASRSVESVHIGYARHGRSARPMTERDGIERSRAASADYAPPWIAIPGRGDTRRSLVRRPASVLQKLRAGRLPFFWDG
jgi:hypothetical protein